jgi:hypothetical protein
VQEEAGKLFELIRAVTARGYFGELGYDSRRSPDPFVRSATAEQTIERAEEMGGCRAGHELSVFRCLTTSFCLWRLRAGPAAGSV